MYNMMFQKKIYGLKLFVDKKSHKVLFAEVPKEFVDFLFHLLSVPIGWVMSIVGKDVMKGSGLSSVYDSVEVLCSTTSTCLLPNFQNNQKLILRPKFSLRPEAGGYVEGTVTYMVLDDLTVKPINTLSLIFDTFNNLKIKDLGSIEELVVDACSKKELPKLVLVAMRSKTVLTDVFLNDDKEEEDAIPRELN